MTRTALVPMMLSALLAGPALAGPEADAAAPQVQVLDLTVEGKAERDAVKAAVDAHYAALETCYTQHLGSDGAWGGMWSARTVIDGKGRAVSAVTTRSSLNVAAIEACALEVLEKLDVDGKKIEGSVQITLAFRPPSDRKAEPIAVAGAPGRARIGPPQGQGLDADVIRDGLEPLQERLTGCYAEALQRKADLSGRVIVGFTLGSQGATSDVKKIRSTLTDDTATRCIVHQFEGLELPTTAGSGAVTVPIALMLSH